MLTVPQQEKMFGEPIAAMTAAYESAKRMGYSKPFYAMSILSDAQFVLEHGDAERARQYINKAKYFLSNAHEEHRKVEGAYRQLKEIFEKKGGA
jgi:uncharacterized protein YcgL (UPF0745 family)